jgi:hypothetical protein
MRRSDAPGVRGFREKHREQLALILESAAHRAFPVCFAAGTESFHIASQQEVFRELPVLNHVHISPFSGMLTTAGSASAQFRKAMTEHP